jgi:branched-chain amino acid transport system permease protein
LLFSALTFVTLLEKGVPFVGVLGITILILIAGAVVIERTMLRPLANRSAMTLFMATLGLSYVIEGAAQGLMGAQVHALDLGIEDVPIIVGGVLISQFDLVAALTAVLLAAVLALLFNRTRIGVSLRAVADDTRAALSVGINLNRIWQIVWAVAGITGLVAGMLWGARQGVQFSLSLVVLKALPVLIIGGLRRSAAPSWAA